MDWPGRKGKRDAEVKRLNSSYSSGWAKAGADLKIGVAKLTKAGEKKEIEITAADGSTTVVTSDHVCIAGIPCNVYFNP